MSRIPEKGLLHVSVSAAAERFVSIEAIKHLITGSAWRDSWDEPNLPKTAHIDFDSVADCSGIFPATLNTTMRLASGESSTPTMLALQTTTKPVALAQAFSGTSALIERQMEQLQMRPNVVFTETVPAFSVGKQAWSGRTGFFMPLLLQALEKQLSPEVPTGAKE